MVILAFPLLAGPGAITSAKLSFQTAGLAVTMRSIAIANVVTYDIIYLTATNRLQSTWQTRFIDYH